MKQDYKEKSRIVKVTATCEFEYFNTSSVIQAENMAVEDAEDELKGIYTGIWPIFFMMDGQ